MELSVTEYSASGREWGILTTCCKSYRHNTKQHGSACLVLRGRGRGGRVARVVQRLLMLLLRHRHALVGDPRPEPRLVRLITHNLYPAVRQLDLVLPLG